MKRLWGNIHFTLLAGLMCAMVMISAGSVQVWGDVTDTASLQSALSSGGTVTLTQSITLTEGVEVSDTVVLDLNGFTIANDTSGSFPNDYLLAVQRGGKLTVSDSSSGQTGAITTETPSVLCGIKMTIPADGTAGSDAELTVEGGKIQGYAYGISGNGKRNGTKITINGGEIRGFLADDSTGIYQPQNGTLTINGGTISGATGIEVRSGTLTVTGGTIQGSVSHAHFESNTNGTTTIGAGIAIAQHVTAQAITAEISDNAHIVGARKIFVSNPENNNTNTVKLKLSDSLVSGLYVGSPDEYGWVKNTEEEYIFHKHDYGQSGNGQQGPKWWWTRVDEEWSARSTYVCKVTGCGHKKALPATVEKSEQHKFVATDTEGKSKEISGTSYNVSVSGGTIESTNSTSGSFEWGQIATVLADGQTLVQWKIGDRMVADGTKKYAFAVTGNTSLTTSAITTPDTQVPVVSTTLTPGTNSAVFNAKWSLPTGAKVISAIIYRGYTTADKNISATTLKAKGTHYDTGLRVVNGDFTFNLDELTTNSYQHMMIEIIYLENGTQKSLMSDLKKEQIPGA